MTKVFPLGVKKDVVAACEPWPAWKTPSFAPSLVASVIGATNEAVPRFCDRFPSERWGTDIGLKLAGAGGDGAQTAAMIVARAAVNEGFDATHIPSYGPESRGGTSYADVRLAENDVLSPAAPTPHALVAFNAPSLAKFGPAVLEGGVVIYDSSVTPDPPALPAVDVLGVPFAEIARSLGAPLVKNVVALGALAEATRILPRESFLTAIRQSLRSKPDLLGVNEQAFVAGVARATRD
jgi:Pyruvate/2-oxoacid:ferredoxin oxidoreductase gamma subunit